MPLMARPKATAEQHAEELAAALERHRRVRDSALAAIATDEREREGDELQRQRRQELDRLKLEREQAELAAQVHQLQRTKIPLPPPRAPSPPPLPAPAPAPKQESAPPQRPISSEEQSLTVRRGDAAARLPLTSVSSRPQGHNQEPPQGAKPVATQVQTPKAVISATLVKATAPNNAATPTYAATVSTRAPAASEDVHIFPGAAKYLTIHTRLKELRRMMTENAKSNPNMKKIMGQMRRDIRKSVGQLTEGRGVNRTPMKAIVDILKESLNERHSVGIDPQTLILTSPSPVEGAANNGPTLPSLFLYVLNIFSKMVISQFIDEAGITAKTADPVGIIAVSIFANRDFMWRNVPLIDILIAKFRVSCPVLFGVRGNEGTEEGRARLGWKRTGQNGGWISEQQHASRMTGLGAGYAAISLRDFSKSQNTNPFPPTNYWRSFASIVNTPPEQVSSTHYTVLRAMIENYEQRFLTFYGSAGRAALQIALVEFPAQARTPSIAASSLQILADKLQRDEGLVLRARS